MPLNLVYEQKFNDNWKPSTNMVMVENFILKTTKSLKTIIAKRISEVPPGI